MNFVKQLGIYMAMAGGLTLAACSGGTQETTQAPQGNTGAQGQNAGEAAKAPAKKEYLVAVDAAYAPFEYQDDKGDIVGFSVDIMKAIAANQGITFKFENTPYEGIFARLHTGEKDLVLASCTITPERQQTMDFSDPYFQASQMIVITDKNKGKINGLNDLKDKLVSVQTGTTGDIVMQNLQGKTSDKIKRMESMPLALNELLKGGVDASVGDNGVINYFVKSHPEIKFTTIVDKDFAKEEYGFAMAKNRKDDLKQIVDAGLKAIKENGKYQEIYNKWFSEDGEAKVADEPKPQN